MQRAFAAIRYTALAAAVALTVFLVAVAYAFLAPATYRATAAVLVEYPQGVKPLPPSQAEGIVAKTVFEQGPIQALTRERAGKQPAAAPEQNAAQASSNDGRVIQLSFSGRTAVDARAVANALSRRAVEQIPKAFAQHVSRAPGATPAPVAARLLRDATLPSRPIRPNRRLVLSLGAVLALALGASAGLGWFLLRRERGTRKFGPRSTRRLGLAPDKIPTPAALPRAATPAGSELLSFDSVRESVSSRTAQPVQVSAPAEVSAPFVGEAGDGDAAPPATLRISAPPEVTPREARSEASPPAAPGDRRRFASETATLIGDGANEVMRKAAEAIRAADVARAKEVSAAQFAAEAGMADETAPPSRPRRRRAGSGGTLMMGSFANPDARQPPAALSQRPPRVADTTYRYSSAPPAAAEAAPEAEKVAVKILTAPGWRPDRSLIMPLHEQLREQLYTFAVEQCFCVLVSSPREVVEDKSRVAAGLALALAETDHPRILLVEGNFHRPSVQRLMHVEVPVRLGFSQQLHARIRPSTDAVWHVVGCTKSLHVLAESIMRSPGMILSKQFESSLQALRKYYDVIIIDGPDTSFEFDCRALDSLVDGLVFVCTDETTSSLPREAEMLFSEKRFTTTIRASAARPAEAPVAAPATAARGRAP
jgi:Mrp family chromosome partitioning ATPase/capsular polysaccharide biosynthesis protein